MLEPHKKQLQEAVAAHRAGRLDVAKPAYEELQKAYPANFDVLHLLGLASFQSGDAQRGGDLVAEALKLNPASAPAHNNLGNILKAQGRLEEARVSFEKAITLKQDYPEALVNRGSILSTLGQVNEALKDFDSALKLVPTYPDAHMARGVALKQLGRPDEALKAFDMAVGLNPRHPEALGNKGSLLTELGRAAEAVTVLENAIKIRPNLASNHYNLANAYLALARPADALASYDKATELNPAYAEAFSNRGKALRDLERSDDALASFDRAISLKADYAEAHSNRGNVLKDLKRPEEALASYDRALALKPDFAEAYNNRGNALRDLKRFDEALASYDKAIALKPDSAEAHASRGNALREMRRFDDALASYREVVRLQPDSADAHTNLGGVLRDVGMLAEATASFDRAISLDPGYARAWAGRARVDSETGRFEEAEERLAKARELDPRAVGPLNSIASIRKFEAGDPLIAEIEQRLSDGSLETEDLAQLHHAYAKICNDIGRYDAAMEHYAIGKRMLDVNHDMDKESAAFAWLKQLFTPRFFAERRDFGVQDERPVFIVGMPRSGTTLTEQVLSGHHAVEGLGELNDMARIAAGLGTGLANPLQFFDAVVKLRQSDVARLAETYQKVYAGCDPHSIRLIDKMPHNFLWLGLIALMFPKARIIHCRRNPMDTCLSIYMQAYITNHNYAKDLGVLGRYYLEYDSLMRHWQQVLPLPMHESVYEDNVADLETSVRAMLSFLDLDWDPNCLNYQDQERQVKTASMWQVRQPIYGTSVERWRRYDKHLGPLKQALGIT